MPQHLGYGLTPAQAAAEERAELKFAEQAAKEYGKSVEETFKRILAPVQLFTNAIANLQSRTEGWVRQGIQTTAYAKILDFEMGELSRQLAAVFLPTIQMVINGLRGLTDWFRSLSGSQQDAIRRFGEAAVVFGVIVTIIPKIEAAFALLNTEVGIFDALTGNLLPVIGGLVAAIGALAVGTETGRNAIAGLWSALQRLWQALQPLIDAFSEVYDQVSIRVSGAFEELGRIGNDVINEIADAVKMVAPFVADLSHELAPLVGWFAELVVYMSAAPFIAFAAGIMLIVEGAKALRGAFTEMLASLKEFLLQIPGFAAAVKWMEELADRLRKKKEQDKKKDRNDLGRDPGQFEDISALYKRIQSMSERKEGGVEEKKPEEKQSDLLDMIHKILDDANEKFIKPFTTWWTSVKQTISDGFEAMKKAAARWL